MQLEITKQLVLIILVNKNVQETKFSCNKNKKPLTVHNKEKQINQQVFKLIYIQWFFVVVYLMTVGTENKGRALTISSYFNTTTQILC